MRFRANKVCPLKIGMFSVYFAVCYEGLEQTKCAHSEWGCFPCILVSGDEVSRKQSVPISDNEVHTLFPSVLWGFEETKCAHFGQRGSHPISIGAMRFRANKVCPFRIGMFSVDSALCYEVSSTQSVPISNNEIFTVFPSVLWNLEQTKCADFEEWGFHLNSIGAMKSRANKVCPFRIGMFSVYFALCYEVSSKTKCAHFEQRGSHPISIGAMRFRANKVCPLGTTRFSPYFHRCYEVSRKQSVPIGNNEVFTLFPSVLWGFEQTKCAHFEERGFHPISIGVMRFRANKVCPFRTTRFSPYFHRCYEVSRKHSVPIGNRDVFRVFRSVLWGLEHTKCAHFEQRGFHPISIGAMRFRANKVCPLGIGMFSVYFALCYEISSKQNVPISKNEVFTLIPSVLWSLAQTKCAHWEWGCFPCISLSAMRSRAHKVCPFRTTRFTPYFHRCYKVSRKQSVPIPNRDVFRGFRSLLWGFAQT